MADNQSYLKREKSPAAAAFLSIFPGCGQFYLGNIWKGIAYILLFGGLITMIERTGEGPVFPILLTGFYVFQIVEAFNDAKRMNVRGYEESVPPTEEEVPSLFLAILVLIAGVVFQLANLNVLHYETIGRLWPLVLIIAGIKVLVEYFQKEKVEEDNEQK